MRGDELGVVPASGEYVAEVGGAGGGYEVMFEEIVVPRGATGLELRGSRCVLSQDGGPGSGDAPDDNCFLVGMIGKQYVFSLSESSWDAKPSCGWTQFTLAGSARSGARLHLFLEASHDVGRPTSCLYDDFDLIATYD